MKRLRLLLTASLLSGLLVTLSTQVLSELPAAAASGGCEHWTGYVNSPPLSGGSNLFTDNFNGTGSLNPANWYVEGTGLPGNAVAPSSYQPYGWWETGQQTETGGELVDTGVIQDYTTSGDGNPSWPFETTSPYNQVGEATAGMILQDKYEQNSGSLLQWCMAAAGTSETTTVVEMFPPNSEEWPQAGEIDFYEDGGSASTYSVTVHWYNANCVSGSDPLGDCQAQVFVSSPPQANTKWNYFSALWSDDAVTVSEDNQVVATIIDGAGTNSGFTIYCDNAAQNGHSGTDVGGAACIPEDPLKFDLQTQSTGATPTAGTSRWDWITDWVE